MKSDEAIRIIDEIANVVTVDIPDEIEIDGKIYRIKEDITGENGEKMLRIYEDLYESIRERIKEMEDVPEDMVKKALILRRAVLFLKDFRKSDEIEDKRRWMEYIKKVRG